MHSSEATIQRFLIAVWPWPGHYFPLLAVAHRLRDRGHEVGFYSSAAIAGVIDGEGFRCFPFNAIDSAFGALSAMRDTFIAAQQPWAMRRFLRSWLLDTLPGQLADLAAILDAWQPDVVVTETAMWGPSAILHEARRIPVAVFSTTAACMLDGPDAPTFGLGLARPRGWRGRVVARGAAAARAVLSRSFSGPVNRLRQSYKLPPIESTVTDHCARMPLYLVPGVPEFDYQRSDLPPSVHYIGPCVWNKPEHMPAPTWLAELPGDQALVHVSEGTVHTQAPVLLRAAAQGLAGLPLQVIMSTGGNREPAGLDLGTRAPNIRLVRWIAHSDLLPRTAVLVTTGGAGTVMAALQAGVPLVVVPTEWDKPDNAQRVVEIGAGVRLSPRRCTPERLRDAVEHVLGEPAYRRNAQKMQHIMAGYDGPSQAADLLEAVCRGERSSRAGKVRA